MLVHGVTAFDERFRHTVDALAVMPDLAEAADDRVSAFAFVLTDPARILFRVSVWSVRHLIGTEDDCRKSGGDLGVGRRFPGLDLVFRKSNFVSRKSDLVSRKSYLVSRKSYPVSRKSFLVFQKTFPGGRISFPESRSSFTRMFKF